MDVQEIFAKADQLNDSIKQYSELLDFKQALVNELSVKEAEDRLGTSIFKSGTIPEDIEIKTYAKIEYENSTSYRHYGVRLIQDLGMKSTHDKIMKVLIEDIDEKLKSLSHEIRATLGIEAEE